MDQPPSIVYSPRVPPADSALLQKFLKSMVMTFDMCHDGLGYDLDTLKQLSDADLQAAENALIDHQPRDWREVEALAQINSPRAHVAVKAALVSRDPQVRQEAQNHLPQAIDPAQREALLIKSLKEDSLFGGLGQAIDEVPDFHPPGVIDALFHGALNRDGEAAVHFAALIFFLHGQAKEPFDWDHRPFFLRFDTANRDERKKAFGELCEKMGVDPAKYVR